MIWHRILESRARYDECSTTTNIMLVTDDSCGVIRKLMTWIILRSHSDCCMGDGLSISFENQRKDFSSEIWSSRKEKKR